MLLHLLLHLLIFHLYTAKDVSVKDSNYVIKWIDQCPNIGYYFTRQLVPNSIDQGICYLCFCQGEHKALCWRRNNRRCNIKSFRYHSFGKRNGSVAHNSTTQNKRIRRSLTLSDIFFLDASKDAPEQCKPYESSFSDDCPPADWCVGCTVCDCDSNGRWHCHILSFCPENKKATTSHKGYKRKTVTKKPILKLSSTTKSTSKKSTRSTEPSENKQRLVTPKHTYKKPAAAKDKTPKKKPSIRYEKVPPKSYTTKSVKYIKINLATHNPIEIKRNKVQNVVKRHKNSSVLVTQQVVKKEIAPVDQTVHKEMSNMTKIVACGNFPVGLNTTKIVKKSNKRSKSILKTVANPNIKSEPNYRAPYKKANKRPIERTLQKIGDTPIMWERRIKRSAISEILSASTNTTTTGTQEVKPTEAEVVSRTTTLNSILRDLLTPASQTITARPLSITTNEREYYIYIATDKTPNFKLLGTKIASSLIEKKEIKEHPDTKISKYEQNKTLHSIIDNMKQSYLNISINPNTIQKPHEQVNILSIDATATGSYLNNYVKGDSEIKELIFYKWPQNKAIRQISVPILVQKPKHILKLKVVNKSIEKNVFKNKVHSKNVDRIAITKKYNIMKILNSNRCPFLNHYFFRENGTKITGKKAGSQDVLNKLLKQYHYYTQRRPRKFNIIRYLRKMFGIIFRRQNASEPFSKHHIMKTICENFGPCKVHIRDKKILTSKLEELDHETITILRTVKIMKGLLKLLDGSTHSSRNLTHEEIFKNDMHKLNDILKDNYTNYFNDSLSVTQLIQIDYIKKNTNAFLKSVKNFAILLNQVIIILTQDDISSGTINSKKMNKRVIKKDPLQKLKYLLLKYNFVQNSFMKRIYEVINSYENKSYDKPKVSPVQNSSSSIAIQNYSRNIHVNLRKLINLAQMLNSSSRAKREARDDDAIEYLLMFMEYLLKQNYPLDATLVNDGIDLLIDAIRNAPDIRTVRKKVLNNELLLEPETTTVINEAYGRRSTENSLNFAEQNHFAIERTSYGTSEQPKTIENEFKMEVSKDIFQMVDEAEEKFQVDRRADVTPDFSIDVTTERANNTVKEDNGLDISIDNDINISKKSMNMLNKGEVKDNINVANIYNANDIYTADLNTEFSITNNGNTFNEYSGSRIFDKSNNNYNSSIFNDLTQNSNNFSDVTENVNNYLYDSFNTNSNNNLHYSKDTVNENGFITVEITSTETNSILQEGRRLQNEEDGVAIKIIGNSEEKRIISMQNSEAKIKQSQTFKVLDSYDSERLDKKSQLEWIEENFGREAKTYEEIRDNIDENVNKTVSLKISRTQAPKKQKSTVKLDVSFISKEVENSKKTNKVKATADEVMLKKQMDLLNSLDYGTEREEFDETEVKDGNAEDRYSDGLSAYYV